MAKQSIITYIEGRIIPQYDSFDKAHDTSHVRKVIDSSLDIAAAYDVDIDMVYVIAAYHDIGLHGGRDGHELRSGQAVMADERLREWFNDGQIITMKEAVEDHRASNKHKPRSIYGMIVAEADRDLSYMTVLRRTIQTGLRQHPEHSLQQHFERTLGHIENKYGEAGYIKLWLETKRNLDGLAGIRKGIADKEEFYKDFLLVYQEELSDAASSK